MNRWEPSARVPSYHPEHSCGLAFVAQSPGKTELERGVPLVGASGRLLKECVEKAGIPWDECYRGNVVEFKPPQGDDFGYFCGDKESVGGKDYTMSPIKSGQYLKPAWFDELDRLKSELKALNPCVVVTLGNEALWALTGLSGITKNRGSVMESTLIPGQKVLPTWHPASVLRAYDQKIDLTLDLIKAKGEAGFHEIKTDAREIWIYPEVKDLYKFEAMYAKMTCTTCGAKQGIVGPTYSRQCYTCNDLTNWIEPVCSIDIETRVREVITCIGFAFDPYHAIVVPFFSEIRPGANYWRELDDEIEAWKWVTHMIQDYPIMGQNYAAYDTWFLLANMGIKPGRLRFDTMIQHHAHMPELSKKLGYLASIYLNVPNWKTLRPRGQKADKRDE